MKWINVNDRLPGKGVKVLVTLYLGSDEYVTDYGYYKNDKHVWLCYDGAEFWPDVVAWKPLPEPYNPNPPIEE